MEARTVNNLPPAGTHDDAICCVLAIELSKKSWIVAVNTPLSDKISRHTLKPSDGKETLGSLRADPDARCQRNEEARGNGFLLRGRLRRLLAPPSAPST